VDFKAIAFIDEEGDLLKITCNVQDNYAGASAVMARLLWWNRWQKNIETAQPGDVRGAARACLSHHDNRWSHPAGRHMALPGRWSNQPL